MPTPQHLEARPDGYYYRAVCGNRPPACPGPPDQHRLYKLDVLKGENGEWLDDFIYQVEEFTAFHAWDPVETCRQARTHLFAVALAYIRRTPLPPQDCPELLDLLMQRFQPRDLAAAYKSQFCA